MSTHYLYSTGSSAAFFSSLVLCPTELIKCKMQANSDIIIGSNMQNKPALVCYVIRRRGVPLFPLLTR